MKRFLSFGAILLTMAGLLVSCYENVIDGSLPVHNLVEVKTELKTAEGTSTTELNENSIITFEGDKMIILSDGETTIYDLTEITCIRFDNLK